MNARVSLTIFVSGMIAAALVSPAQAQLGRATPVPTDPNRVVVQTPVPTHGVLPAPAVVPASGRFRLVALSFACVHQTVDDPLENDGAGDEIQIRSDNIDFDRTGRITGSTTARTGVFGAPDRTDFAAGTGVPGFSAAAPVGGLITGNSYPPPGHTPRAINDLPMTLWEGTLSRGQTGELIVPSIWEIDGSGQSTAQRDFNSGLTAAVQAAAPTIGAVIGNAGRALPPGAATPGLSLTLLPVIRVFDDGSRPIGSGTHPGPSIYLAHAAGMRVPALLLTYDEAERIASRPAGPASILLEEGQVANDAVSLPAGAVLLQILDRPQLQGNYYMIMQLQRI